MESYWDGYEDWRDEPDNDPEDDSLPKGWDNAPIAALAAWAVAGDDPDLFDQIKAELQGE